MPQQADASERSVAILQAQAARVLGDHERPGPEQPRPAELPQQVMVLGDLVVRRIEENVLKARALAFQARSSTVNYLRSSIVPILMRAGRGVKGTIIDRQQVADPSAPLLPPPLKS